MEKERTVFDRKSLKSVTGKTANLNELAKDCVAFANAKGGELYIGIEDKEDLPPKNQTIKEHLPENVIKRINELTINVYVQSQIITAENGGQFFILSISRSAAAVASTTKGQYYYRDGDTSRPIMPDELIRLIADKSAYCWETKVVHKIPYKKCDSDKLTQFIADINKSNRVSPFVKNMPEEELLSHYVMIDEHGFLTNLGILWIGKKEQRARLIFSPTVQYIKYDQADTKVKKIVWDDYSLNPKELVESIWDKIPDWKEANEVSEGLWRKEIPAYDEKVVREVLCNSIVHRSYTTRGDIFINIYLDRMEVKNPGTFPIGVTVNNILQKSVQRNEHLAKVFYDLHLMEKEGSGYDLIYETLLSAGKDTPKPFEGDDFVQVTIYRNIINKEAARLIEYLRDNYPKIAQKGYIALGLILKAKTIKNSDLAIQLQLPEDERVRSYVQPLLDDGIISSRGRGRGTKYTINPGIITSAKSNIPTTLKTIEPYRLKELIKEDLKYHPNSSAEEICKRLPDADLEDLIKLVRKMAENNEIVKVGGRKYRKYRLP